MQTLSPVEFFQRVWPSKLLTNETLEMRYIDRAQKGFVRRIFFHTVDSFLENVDRYREHDIYFGVSTRYGTGTGKKRDCYRSQVVWADLDGKKIADCDFDLKPNILVNSGGGVHAYWILNTSTLVRDEEKGAEIEAINRALANKLEADIAAIDFTRILRVPGTLNHKYDPYRKVEAFLVSGKNYTIEDFKRHGFFEKKQVSEVNVDLNGGRIITNLPRKVAILLSQSGGVSHGGDFSRQDSAVITALLSSGLSPEDTYATFVSSARGKHAAERKEGHLQDYVARTIKKALSFLGQNSNGSISVDFRRKKPTTQGEGLITQKVSDISIETPRWVWPGYLPEGKLTLLVGDPGMGKSTIALDILSRISKGTHLPFSRRTITGTSLIASAEDAASDTIAPRLIAAGADRSRIEILKEIKTDEGTMLLSFPRDLDYFRKAIIKKGARIVVIDPLNAFLSRDVDSHRDQDVRGVLMPFEDIAEETGASIVIVAHLNKREDSSILYRVGGSIGLVGAARSVMAVSHIPDKATRVLYSMKSTLSETPVSLEYEVRQFTKTRDGNEWKGDPTIKSSKIRWMGEIDFDPRSGVGVSQDKATRAAEAFLRQVIEDSEAPVDEIFREARQAGVARPQLMRVKESLDVATFKKKGKWYWKLPD